MNALKSSSPSVVKPLVVALALALSGSAAFAESMDDVVKTRPDQTIDQHYGRSSVYGLSADDKAGTIAQVEAQPYGRAGGFAGSDRVVVLSNTATNSDLAVKSGELVGNAADTRAKVPDNAYQRPMDDSSIR